MPRLLILGLGYTASRLGTRMWDAGWDVIGVRRTGSAEVLAFDDPALPDAIRGATHILSSVPPEGSGDPVLTRHAEALRASPARWIGYLSSTGVYGDAAGAWVDETAPVGTGRRSARAAADLAWQALRPDLHVFRLPGIYGPGRSALDRLAAPRVDAPGHRFSRIHVDDIVGAVIASFEAAANLATRIGVEGGGIVIHTPLLSLTKADIIRRGLSLGVDYEMTISCYDPDGQGRSCGDCDACLLRARGFAEAGSDDPVRRRCS